MYVVCVQVHVKPEFVDQFIVATQDNHEHTRRDEPGNVRWDLIQAEDDPTRFMIYEVYRTQEDFPTHQQTAPFLGWKEAVTDWMAEPRSRMVYANVFPADQDWAK